MSPIRCNKANLQYIVVNLYTAVGGRVSNVATNLYVLSLRSRSGVFNKYISLRIRTKLV